MIEFVGYDSEGDKVWRVGPDQYIGLCRNEEHVRRVMAQPGWTPFTLAEYKQHFGPITKATA